eukprot:UN22783
MEVCPKLNYSNLICRIWLITARISKKNTLIVKRRGVTNRFLNVRHNDFAFILNKHNANVFRWK